LRECRFVSLTDGLRSGDQSDGAVFVKPNVDIFRRIAAGGFDVAGKA